MMEPAPRKPDESECCGSGCKRCIFDIYEEECKIWERKLEGSLGFDELATLQPDHYLDLTITRIQQLTTDTKAFTLSAPGSKKISGLKMGQHVIVKAKYSNETISRQYTPIDMNHPDGNLHLVIKLYSPGKMSHLITEWNIGEIVQCRGPMGDRTNYYCNKWETVILVAAGTGITPMVKIIQTILQNEDEETTIFLLYACRTYEDILLKNMLDKWTDYWNFHVVYFLSREQEENLTKKKKYKEEVFCNRVKAEYLRKLAYDKNLHVQKAASFICGPFAFEMSMEQHLLNCGFQKDNIHKF